MKTDTKQTENTAESGNKSKPLLQDGFVYGEFAVSEYEVKQNKMGWNEIDYLKHYLKSNNCPIGTGWYAKILRDGIFKFKITNDFNIRSKKEYLRAYMCDGWETVL